MTSQNTVLSGGLKDTEKTVLPPLPFNNLADLDLPIFSLGDGKFLIDDREVDYIAREQNMQAEKAMKSILFGEEMSGLLEGANEPQGGESQQRVEGGLYLDIAAWPMDGKLISFNSRTGLVYQIEESTNLVDWTLYETIVANDTNESFYVSDIETRFFRAIQMDERVQYHDWDDYVEQFVYFDAWTSIQGTYSLGLYADGALVYSVTNPVPANGKFGVFDGNYNPANWPNAGYYGVDVWEFRTVVTPTAGSGTVTNAVQKKFRKPYQTRRGLTIQLRRLLQLLF